MNTDNAPENKAKRTEESLMDNTNDLSNISESFQSIMNNPKLTFKIFDTLPTPIEVFRADGVTIYVNQASMEMAGCTDASLIVEKYNLWTDPVCLKIIGQEVMDRIFRGEAVTFPNFNAPVQDVLDRGVIEEKPWEAATMDLQFQPIWDGDNFLCTICFFTVKSMYKGRADIVDAKKYIDEHWLDEFDSKAVAKALSINHDHLRALFKQHTGMTMNDYYKKVKVDHIKEKLADKNRPISEVFDACGEDSRGWMARVFKEITGMSPKEYRDGLK